LFKKIYNRTPYQYLTDRRLSIAKERLKHNVSISEVCNAVGFDSVTSFSLKFKAYTGEPPALFRLRAMQKQKLAKEQPLKFIPACFSAMHRLED
jgi:AraC-like DNA-binding protein